MTGDAPDGTWTPGTAGALVYEEPENHRRNIAATPLWASREAGAS